MAIEIKNLNYFYSENLIRPYQALFDINLKIEEGDIVAIAGSTGSGKSTLAEITAGLTLPTSGEVIVDGVNIYAKKNKQERILAKEARKKIGMVFQYADYQLFEETVEKDIAFAPKQLGFSAEIVREKVNYAINLLSLSEDIKNRVPFNLSGGEKRKVAIAGILSFSPKYLILDEPTVGLDAKGRDEILNLILRLNREENTTVIFISHSMESIAEISNKMIVMKDGKILKYDAVYNVFNDKEILKEAGLSQPKISLFLQAIKDEGLNVNTNAIKLNDGIKEITEAVK